MSVYLHEEDVLQAPAPVNTVAPAITGTTTVGSTLTVSNGTWTDAGSPAFTRQWQRDAFGNSVYSNIGSATSSTYVLVNADDGCNIRCNVTDTDANGATTQVSNVVGTIVEPAPVNTVAPAVTGTRIVGQTLTSGTGTWTGMGGHTAAFTYQWQRDASGNLSYSNIAAATAATHVLVNADLSCNVRCVVTATNDTSGVLANSNALLTGAPVGPFVIAMPMVADIVAEWAVPAGGNYRVVKRRRLLMSIAMHQVSAGVTTTGAQAVLSAADGVPFATYAVSVKGVGAAATSWTVNLEGSLDGVNWTTICTHNASDGSTVWDTNGKAARSVRANVSALSLGSATGVDVHVVAVP